MEVRGRADPPDAPWALDEKGLEQFPGAALLLDRRGAAMPANVQGALLLRRDDPDWQAFLNRARAALRRRAAALSPVVFGAGGEALFLPLADGERVLLLLHEGAAEAPAPDGQRYRDLVEISGDFAWEVDSDGCFSFVPPRGAFGWAAADLLGRPAADFVLDPAQAASFVTLEPLAVGELRFRRADGGTAYLGLAALPVNDSHGQWIGARGVCRDLSESRERDQALAQARLRERLMVHIARAIRDEPEPAMALSVALAAIGLALGATGGVVLRHGDAVPMVKAAAWGPKPAAAALAAARATLSRGEAVTLTSAGVHLIGHAARYRQTVEGAIVLWRVAEAGDFHADDRALLAEIADHLGIAIAQIAHQERILRLTRSDPLTGLLNRYAFFEEFPRRLGRLDRGARTAALLSIELGNLRQVNRGLGTAAGDAGLRAVADILRENTRSGDLVARYGGDEFVLWIEGIAAPAAAQRAAALVKAGKRLAALNEASQPALSLFIGIAIFDPRRPELPLQLLARAEASRRDGAAAPKSADTALRA